jgi:hypothetical protein
LIRGIFERNSQLSEWSFRARPERRRIKTTTARILLPEWSALQRAVPRWPEGAQLDDVGYTSTAAGVHPFRRMKHGRNPEQPDLPKQLLRIAIRDAPWELNR